VQSDIADEILEHLPDAVLVVGRDGRIERANLQAETLFGFPRAELIGQPVELLMPERLRARHEHNRHGYFKVPSVRPMGTALSLFGRQRDGSEFPVDITLGPLGQDQGRVVCVIRDISERKLMEQTLATKNHELRGMTQQLWQTAKLATMGELAASIAHELNNPLGIVSLRIESLLAQIPPQDEKHQALGIVAEETVLFARHEDDGKALSGREVARECRANVCTEVMRAFGIRAVHARGMVVIRGVHLCATTQPDRDAEGELTVSGGLEEGVVITRTRHRK